ncbi:dTDP-4-dehydrorhamnose reductase family protein [Paraburkholderia hospita]|uniref:dTDP-4-dehydrorhamnose reductase family protein n=1 Tax=Paraburkholderia hospita TaxID=169430 RepID=UPI0002718B08|nr:SDR family oxidoreductase [Paraburkholderia hospita]EUC14721.1 dTDP-4-dehydrorhamnose reductase [Burkholderia sp. BT03]SKC94025.1 dTDP-4-dehydrorhamnose reductase [Paraburkholderia hospita]
MRILVLGISGMLGHTAFGLLNRTPDLEVFGTARSESARARLDSSLHHKVIVGVDVLDHDALLGALARIRPDVVLNCVGLIKQLENANDPLAALPLNALFPHRLRRACELLGARLIHISTDCVFSGTKGNYKESDIPDANDLYGRSKLLGEVVEQNSITLRTSIIGRELGGNNGLVEWFLSQKGKVRGYTKAVFSGLTTDELVGVVVQHVLPNPQLSGLWHVSSAPIAKHDLLTLVRDVYGTDIQIEPDDTLKIDRSLNSDRFRTETGYSPPTWAQMITAMRNFEVN